MTGVRVSNRRIYGFRPSGFGVYSGPVYSLAEEGILIDSKNSSKYASIGDSVEGITILNVYGVEVADLENVSTKYYFICPDENDTSIESSVLFRGKYDKTLYNCKTDDYSSLLGRLRVLLESLYGEPTTSKVNNSYGNYDQQILKWESDKALITLNISINYDGFIPYYGMVGSIDLKITYEWKEMLKKEEYYKELSKNREQQKKKDEILSSSSTEGL